MQGGSLRTVPLNAQLNFFITNVLPILHKTILST